MKGLFATKVGMTRVQDAETGRISAVTVLKAEPHKVVRCKTTEKDGYSACVVATGTKKSKSNPYKAVRECDMADGAEAGAEYGAEIFDGAEEVSICGKTRGRGFAGVVKRWNFKTGRNTHGSHHHREPGSVGQCSKPGRIFKGKKLPGHYGNTQKTITVKIASIDAEKGLIAVYGSVPGANKSQLFIQHVA